MIRVIRQSSLVQYSAALVSLMALALFAVPGLWRNLLATGANGAQFMQHQECYRHVGALVGLHFFSDLLIGTSYVAISLTLAYLARRARRDTPFHWVFLAFGLFIIACGSTHFMEAWTTFRSPVYWLAGYLKLITAVASVGTAVVLPPLVPRALALVREAKLSERRGLELESANRQLKAFYRRAKDLAELKSRASADDAPLPPLSRLERLALAPLVLVAADDAETVRRVAESVGANCRVESARGGVEVLERESAVEPDLIVCDAAATAGMTGEEFVRAVRADERLRDVPILMLSARADDALRVRLLREGAQDYMTKPFVAEELRARAENLIEIKLTREILQHELASQSRDLTELAREVAARRGEAERVVRELRDANLKLEAIIEASPLAIVALDREGLVRSWNPAAERIYGWPQGEVLGRPLPTVPEEMRAEMERNHRAAVSGESFTNYETTRVRKDGTFIEVSISTAPLLGEGGEPAGVVALVADITERKRADEALARQSASLREQSEVIEQAYDAIFLRDPSNVITLWNRGAERTYGYAKEEALGRSPHELLKTEFPAPLEEIYASLRRDGYWEGELRHARKDGEKIVVESRWANVKDERGEVMSVLEITRDITERKRAEEAVRVSETRFRSLVEQSPLSTQVFSPEGLTVGVNRAWERLWGVKLSDFPEGYNILADEQLVERGVMPYIRRAFAGEAAEVPEVAYVPDRGEYAGQERWVQARIYPVQDEGGNLREVVLVHEDVTDRRRAERALRESEERFAKAFAASPLALTISSLRTGRLLEVNDTFTRMSGYARGEAVGRTTLELGLWADAAERESGIAALKGAGRVRDVEARFLLKDGTGRVGLMSAERIEIGGEPCALTVIDDITEQKRAEAERERLAAQIEGERRRLKELVANVPGVVWEAWGEPDASSQRIDFVSDYVERMLGYTVEEWLETPNFWLTIVHPEDRERAAREAREKFDSLRGGTSQFRWVRKDGRAIEVEAQSLVILDDEGRPVGMRGVTMDITERKRAEMELVESRRRLQIVTDSAPVFIAFCDREARYIFVNEPFAARLGLAREEIIGRRIPEVLGEEAYAVFRHHVEAVLAGRRVEFESEVPYRGLGRRFMNATYVPRRDDEGAVQGFVAVVTDVTERREREEEEKFLGDATTVLASSLDYAATLEAVARMSARYLADYCLVDLLGDDGSITRLVAAHRDPGREGVWREMQRRFPVAPDSRHTVVKVLTTGEPDLLTDMTDEALAEAIPDAEHRALLRRLGVRSAMTVPLQARGRIVGAVSFISAETGRRYTERELRVAEELARRAALAVDNARLFERAQEANRAKDEFLATLSHELRTPLTPIVGWVHLIGNDGVDPADFRHGLAVIDKNSQTLSRLINDLLDMSAILNGKMRIDRAPVRLDSVLHEAVETVRAQADTRGVRVELAPCAGGGEDAATIEGDRTRLVQVFWNLLTNAVKFSSDGGRVRVSCAREGQALRVAVEDDGLGIAPEFLPHVFDRFRQADMSTTKLYGGLGIGLSLVRSFVEAHGGTVRAESEGLGRGSRFTVTLPLTGDGGRELGVGERTTERAAAEHTATERRAVAEPTRDVSESAPSPQPLTPDPLRVLVVEDAPDTLELLRLFLTARGYEATLCASAEEALDVATRGHFDIIVSDIGLPRTDGYQLLASLRRQSPSLARVPALALTGYAAESDVEAALAAGYDAHLAKPFEPDALADALERLLAPRAT